MYLVWGKGRASDNGYKAHHNRTPLNSICRIGNKPCLVYLGSHTRPHNSHTEIASRERKPKNFLAKLVSSSYRYLYLHNGTGTEKFLLAREGWKVWPFFLEGEWSIGGNRSVERIGGYVREKGMVERRRQRGARVFREHALPGVTKCLEGWDEISRGWRGSIPAFLLLALNFWCAPRLEYAAGERAGKEE